MCLNDYQLICSRLCSPYTVEVFSDGSRSPEVVKKDILADTGMVPSVYEHGTHYVVNHKTTLGTLERIQKYPDVQEIKGKYSTKDASTTS